MPVSVVVGGQFGSEGKGKVAHWIAGTRRVDIAVRVGGPNAGHTALDEGRQPVIFRHLPTAALYPDVICVLGAGTLVDPEVFLAEVERTRLTPDRVFIDPNATVITSENKQNEQASGLREAIGSTLSGTGRALEQRLRRDGTARLAINESRLSSYVRKVQPLLRATLKAGGRVLIEGTQGFGLSVLHSAHYPHVTSRDTTAATFVAESGLSPLDVDEIYLVLRAFPIRVGGNSGPLSAETDWSTITRESGSKEPLAEYTSVTRTLRRVARFDAELVRSAIGVNQPTHVVLNHLDHVDSRSKELGSTRITREFVANVEREICSPVHMLGFGPGTLLPNDGAVHCLLADAGELACRETAY